MAIAGASITSAILAAGSGIMGQTLPTLARVVGNAVGSWAKSPINVLVVGNTVGQAGSGTVTGKLFLSPSAPIILGGLNGAGVQGQTASMIAAAVAIGVATAFTSSAQYTGVSAGVGNGTDISTVKSTNPATLIPLIAAGFQGTSGFMVAQGLGNGIADLIKTATGIGVVTGAGGTAPGTGTTPFSSVF